MYSKKNPKPQTLGFLACHLARCEAAELVFGRGSEGSVQLTQQPKSRLGPRER